MRARFQSTTIELSGSVIAEKTGEQWKDYVYSGSALLASIENGTTTYWQQNHLSNALATDAAGNEVGGTGLGKQGHLPFGEPWYGDGLTNWKFTTYERESESALANLDYAINRHYNSRLGRFLQVDPLSGDLSNPQSLNRYAYVLNDPTNLSDPLGLRANCPEGPPCPGHEMVDPMMDFRIAEFEDVWRLIDQLAELQKLLEKLDDKGAPPGCANCYYPDLAWRFVEIYLRYLEAVTNQMIDDQLELQRRKLRLLIGGVNRALTPVSELAFQAEAENFPGKIDPYGGAYRHCVAACLLRQDYAFLAPLMVWGHNLLTESYSNPNSIGDMAGEKLGLCEGKSNSDCATSCLKYFPWF